MIRLTFTSVSSALALMLLVACSGASSSDTGQLAPSVTSGGEGAKAGDSKATTSAPSAGNSVNGDAGTSQTGRDGGATQPGDQNGGDPQEENGQGGRVSVGEHCCFNGKYLKCPDANACFGGFDINTCLQGCNPFDPCFDACFDKLNKASAPKGCDANATPPPGVDCANGQINL